MYWFDYTYLIILPAFLFGLYAQMKVSSTFSKYQSVQSSRGVTGAQAARRILDDNGLYDVAVVKISGNLTDNFNPKTRTVSLSDSVYGSTSVAAIGGAAHECGHAVQHATGYTPIKIRSALVPVTNFGSSAGFVILLVGMLFGSYPIAMLGVLLYSLMAVFQAVTLPVEFNASKRALATLEASGMLVGEELKMSRSVLSAAAMTYFASLLTSLVYFLRFLLYVLMLSGRKRN